MTAKVSICVEINSEIREFCDNHCCYILHNYNKKFLRCTLFHSDLQYTEIITDIPDKIVERCSGCLESEL